MEYNEITKKIIAAAIEVHKELGPGLLESVYEYCLYEELSQMGLYVQSQVKLPIVYKGKTLEKVFFIDFRTQVLTKNSKIYSPNRSHSQDNITTSCS